MIIDEINGDVLNAFSKSEFDGLIHGCNCFCNMGAGVALAIKNKYPESYLEDLKTTKGDKSKLGSYSTVTSIHGIIVNLYSQYHYGFGKVNADYDAIASAFKKLNEEFKGLSFCTVKLGAGLAGGNWNIIKKLIDENTPDLKITVFYI